LLNTCSYYTELEEFDNELDRQNMLCNRKRLAAEISCEIDNQILEERKKKFNTCKVLLLGINLTYLIDFE
jgi:hypothetical protein